VSANTGASARAGATTTILQLFSGMSDDAVLAYQKMRNRTPADLEDGFTANGAERMFGREQGPDDPLDVIREFGHGGRPRAERPAPEAARGAQRRAQGFDTLGLEIDAAAAEIKARSRSW